MLDEQTTSLDTLTQWATYVYTTMAHAKYERIDDGQTVYAEIPDFPGVWATGPTFHECRAELLSTLEDLLAYRLQRGITVPAIAGVPAPQARPVVS